MEGEKEEFFITFIDSLYFGDKGWVLSHWNGTVGQYQMGFGQKQWMCIHNLCS
ncbi:hypothetical protein Pint_11080 [Pistacia integerrima]|uniref:Uncharacterized protein n=1 Tax=Pistacia integerrima TaxID=434235 RepID=A0ACC0XHE7_9ROSI|nr:hypothetical protein Pint_11080 [Pistacia integerrima]